MSGLKLAENIVKNRKNRGITQEELAEFIGVTKASVSKWETGTTTPDIQILPQLASFFDISVDELLGYEAQLTKDQIRFYYQQLAHDFAEKPFDEVMEKCESLVKQYYCCYEFLENIAGLLLNHANLAGSEEKGREVLKRAEQLCHRVMENCREISRCENAAAICGVIQLYTGRADEVVRTFSEKLEANRVDDYAGLLMAAYLQLGQYNQAELVIQVEMYRGVLQIIESSVYMLSLPEQPPEKIAETIRRTDVILEHFQVGTLHPNESAKFHYQAALVYCGCLKKAQEEGEMIEAGELEGEVFSRLDKYCSAVERLLTDGIKLHGDDYFSRLDEWLEGLVVNSEVRAAELVRESVSASLQNPVFHLLSGQERLQRIKERIARIQIKKSEK